MKSNGEGGLVGMFLGLIVPPTVAVTFFEQDPEVYKAVYYFITHWFFIYFPVCYFIGDFLASPFIYLPKDSALPRKKVDRVKFMIETVTSPCPTDPVLRRHHEQLIANRLNECRNDEGKMKALIKEYEEHTKTTKDNKQG